MLLMSTFFFYSYAHPQDLHSFPTRRSSDLGNPGSVAVFRRQLFAPREEPERSSEIAQMLQGDRLGRERRRSEEHTSELQSQFHLVCRLLLEKKNNSKGIRTTPTTVPPYAHT